MGAPARIERGREEKEHAHALWAAERGGCEASLVLCKHSDQRVYDTSTEVYFA